VLALHVDAGVRHRGVARALVAAAREALQARGVERLGARVEHNDDARISMGERWGWIRGWEWMDSGTSD
jgi:ribosomal protein S18 acetylase RimI-like enzyme